ncbi:MAG: hypothetical protein RMJ05_06925 [Thermomicrobium sp.]|nr:hypothetical protein [Thermomicrobium sp.]MDW8059998.1 hypothetical protein [Thermomicrobium sp.]
MAGPGTPLLSEPTVWSARLLAHLDKTYVYVAALTNRNYEGEARAGGTVKAFYVSDVTVSDYTGGWSDSDWAALSDNEVTIQIDQAKKILVKVPDVRDQFSVIDLIDQATQRMAVAIGDAIDQYVASKYAEVASANQYGDDTTPVTVGLGNGETRPTVALVRLREVLAEARAPMTNPRVVVPVWFATMLSLELGSRATQLGDRATQEGMVAPGFLGTFEGLQVYVSPNVPNTTGTKYKVLAGDPMITFASAIEKVETTRLQNDFATGVKALYVYGAKLPRGQYLALGTFNRGSYA